MLQKGHWPRITADIACDNHVPEALSQEREMNHLPTRCLTRPRLALQSLQARFSTEQHQKCGQYWAAQLFGLSRLLNFVQMVVNTQQPSYFPTTVVLDS